MRLCWVPRRVPSVSVAHRVTRVPSRTRVAPVPKLSRLAPFRNHVVVRNNARTSEPPSDALRRLDPHTFTGIVIAECVSQAQYLVDTGSVQFAPRVENGSA